LTATFIRIEGPDLQVKTLSNTRKTCQGASKPVLGAIKINNEDIAMFEYKLNPSQFGLQNAFIIKRLF
jgi:hypothetical protein